MDTSPSQDSSLDYKSAADTCDVQSTESWLGGSEEAGVGPSQASLLPEDLEEPAVSIVSRPSKCAEQAEDVTRKVWSPGWRVVPLNKLPEWMRKNDFLLQGHRPPSHSFHACFQSIFRLHTETGNIWTHLLGMMAFLGIAGYFLTRPVSEVHWQEKSVFSPFFAGAILCLSFSTIFHTVFCHSEHVGRFVTKLDYCGIALLIVGSFVPWLYYGFYCRPVPRALYLVLILMLGSLCTLVSMMTTFARFQYRALRAGTFACLGLSGVVPVVHFVVTEGFWHAVHDCALGWLTLTGLVFMLGAVVYVTRVPERLYPGKFDLWFQSHQLWHLFVLAGAFVQYHGISQLADYRLTQGGCVQEGLS